MIKSSINDYYLWNDKIHPHFLKHLFFKPVTHVSLVAFVFAAMYPANRVLFAKWFPSDTIFTIIGLVFLCSIFLGFINCKNQIKDLSKIKAFLIEASKDSASIEDAMKKVDVMIEDHNKKLILKASKAKMKKVIENC